MLGVNRKGVMLSLLAAAAAQLCSCDGPAVRVPVREMPREQEPEPDAGDATCEDSAICSDPERRLCSPTGECVQCIVDSDCPLGDCEHGECEEDEEEPGGGQ